MKKRKSFKKYLEEKKYFDSQQNESILGAIGGLLKGGFGDKTTNDINEAEQEVIRSISKAIVKFTQNLASLRSGYSPTRIQYIRDTIDNNLDTIVYKSMQPRILDIDPTTHRIKGYSIEYDFD
mgnify:CR=1 FL=1